jgi:type II secretory pathway pseudopilin PulG
MDLNQGFGAGFFAKKKQNISIADQGLTAGFTLVENIIIIIMISIVGAIAAHSWLSLVDRIRLTTAQDRIFQAKREAQTKADRNNEIWQVSIKLVDDIVYWAVHPKTIPLYNVNWQQLDSNIALDINETTLRYSRGIWQIQFNHQGRTNGQLGRVTLTSKNNPTVKRCVFVSTLLGTIRTGQNQKKPNSGKYCY